MLYGSLKDSGMGKEGSRYAVQDITELKLVVFHVSASLLMSKRTGAVLRDHPGFSIRRWCWWIDSPR